jgi:hypothetical protein
MPKRPPQFRRVISISAREHPWLLRKPAHDRDIRNLDDKFMTISDARRERRTRAQILRKGHLKVDQRVFAELQRASPRKPSAAACDPLLTRRFQIAFVSEALAVHAREAERLGEPQRYTFINLDDRVPYNKLHTIDWRI